MKFCVARTSWVERHLDVVLKVLQVVGSKFIFYETCRYLPFERFTKKIRMVAVLMTDIFNSTAIEEKTSSRSLSYKKFHKRQNDQKGRTFQIN